MKNIVLACASAMSTNMLAKKMRQSVEKKGYTDIEIKAYGLGELKENASECDIILLGPQVSYQLKRVQEEFPETPVYVINMTDYGMMDGEKVLAFALSVINGGVS